MKFKLGSDPELMLEDSEKRVLKSAITVIPEGKGEGRNINKGAALHDNVLVEFNTDPADSEDEFIDTLTGVLNDLAKLVNKSGCGLLLQASAEFPAEELAHPEAMVFGCDPDWDAWIVGKNTSPDPFEVGALRSAGGHLHIGMGDDPNINAVLDHPLGKLVVVKAMDVFCLLPWLMIEQDPTSKRRRELYGKAGAFRPKPYGVEYRAISASWLTSPAHARLIYRLVDVAVSFAAADGIDAISDEFTCGPKLQSVIEQIGGAEIQRIINQSDIEAAKGVYDNVLKPLIGETLADYFAEVQSMQVQNFNDAWRTL